MIAPIHDSNVHIKYTHQPFNVRVIAQKFRWLRLGYCELVWWLLNWKQRAESDNGVSHALPLPEADTAEDQPDGSTPILRSLLRRTPYWIRGHLLLGQIQLRNRLLADAYLSAMAVKTLSTGHQGASTDASILLSQVYLSSGEAAAAKTELEPFVTLKDGEPINIQVQEEYAAACIALELFPLAEQSLAIVPERLSNPTIDSMRNYLHRRSDLNRIEQS